MGQQAEQQHRHDPIYYGVVNLIHESIVIGTIDVWRCRSCNDIFCEDKRFGLTDLAPEVGFPKVEPGAKWAALTCAKDKGADWTLTGVSPGKMLVHSCTPETKVELKVAPDYSLEPSIASGIGKHRIILLETFVNQAVDILTGRKHTGPTNANPAPGRPFSFAPEKQATVRPSRLNLLTVSSFSLFLSGIASALVAGVSLTDTMLRGAFVVPLLLGIGAGYLTFKVKSQGPTLGLAEGVLGLLVLFVTGLFSRGPEYQGLLLLLILSTVLAWLARSRIKNMSEQRWHPLDMPAYG